MLVVPGYRHIGIGCDSHEASAPTELLFGCASSPVDFQTEHHRRRQLFPDCEVHCRGSQ
jgi:hypothetical protein